jgi:hypothetical protein
MGLGRTPDPSVVHDVTWGSQATTGLVYNTDGSPMAFFAQGVTALMPGGPYLAVS